MTIEERLAGYMYDMTYVSCADCPGLKQDWVSGRFDDGTVRGELDGPAEVVLRMLEKE